MGCDIHVVCQRRKPGGAWEDLGISIWENRNYSVFGFLAGVRNYSAVEPLSKPRGLPENDQSFVNDPDDYYYHSTSWFSIEELLAIDPNREVEDRRYMKQEGPNSWNGTATCAEGEGEKTTLREFLGEKFFDDIERAKKAGTERVVFAFDN